MAGETATADGADRARAGYPTDSDQGAASDVRELAEQLRLEIEHALGKQCFAQRRVYGELVRREIEDEKRTLASEAQREHEALEARRKVDEDRNFSRKEAG